MTYEELMRQGWKSQDEQRAQLRARVPEQGTLWNKASFPTCELDEPALTPCSVVVEFDGGAKRLNAECHGEGYGSFRISEDGVPYAIERVTHEEYGLITSNAAEVHTLVRALIKARQLSSRIHVIGDSQNALMWSKRLQCKGGSSQSLKHAIWHLRQAARGLQISTEWKPRKHMVALFGH